MSDSVAAAQKATSALNNHSSKPNRSEEDEFKSDSLSAHDTGKCQNCGKNARLICNGCKGLPAPRGNSKIVIRYCTKECQKEHWTMHKPNCKAAKTRQHLYRVADLTKALFYIHSEITFTWSYLKKIDSYGSIRAVYLDEEKSNARKTLLVPFSTVTDLVSDQKEQFAYLSHLSCNEAVAKFGTLLAERLKGNCPLPNRGIVNMNMFGSKYPGMLFLIEEITVTIKNPNLEIGVWQTDVGDGLVLRKDGTHHKILRVTLTSQDQYAVDLTGAQYGHHEECLPWPDYVAARVDQIIEVQAFGATKTWLAKRMLEEPYPSNLVQSLNISFLEELGLCIRFWEGRGESVSALLALPEEQYEAKKVSFLEFVKTSMKLSREDSIKNGSWCRK